MEDGGASIGSGRGIGEVDVLDVKGGVDNWVGVNKVDGCSFFFENFMPFWNFEFLYIIYREFVFGNELWWFKELFEGNICMVYLIIIIIFNYVL